MDGRTCLVVIGVTAALCVLHGWATYKKNIPLTMVSTLGILAMYMSVVVWPMLTQLMR